ncbi:MAG: GNAT family N-acetyltransferase [Thermoproteus sp.]|jgi:ribosomal-protein-alanine N-acetyltransferase|uniref:N-alpha-acetyltransferase n=1 Tax=Thermoproteus uzoniensis (strain 768-20) TaxID=999630 RepID=F2L1N7_THEU7|nr:N-acetyltransferase [Thermoproteus uzoniensis]AEA12893.1 ribosomal-protein-alanine acetyltransferase [Thermoproteus uzoniensis 768-20]
MEIVLEGPQEFTAKDGRRYVLREFKMADLNSVVSINRRVLPENYPEWFFVEHHMSFPKAFIVAEMDGELVGYMMNRVEYGWSYINKGKAAHKGHVVSIGVLPHARRLGIATNMMLRGMKAMKRFYDAEEVFLEVRVSNTPAISLYKKLGYEIAGRIPRYYSDGEDAYIMARTLADL